MTIHLDLGRIEVKRMQNKGNDKCLSKKKGNDKYVYY